MNDGAVVLHGSISAADQQTLLAKIDLEGAEVKTEYENSLAWYTMVKHSETMTTTDEDGNTETKLKGSAEELYFSFGATQTLVTQNRELMQAFVDSNGYLGGFENNDAGALVILHADRALLQGGANTSVDFNDKWESSILKNLKSAALVVAEENGGIHVNVELTAASEDAAMSVRNIAEGLVALKALEAGDDVTGDFLRAVKFENDGAILSIDVVVAADQVGDLKDL